MTLLLLYLALALGVSFLCSILEAVILSVSPTFVHTAEQRGVRAATVLRRLKENVDQPLTAILTLNTVAHTVGAAGVGAQAVALWGEAWFGLVSAILTLLILLLSEIVPKTIGALWWRELALPATRLLQGMIVLTWPLVVLSRGIMRLLGRRQRRPGLSRQEFAAMASYGLQLGILNPHEAHIIRNLAELVQVRVSDILTPRTVMVAAPETLSLRAYLDTPAFQQFSRLPLYRESLDDVDSYVLKAEVLAALAQGHDDQCLRTLARPLPICPEQLQVARLLEQLLPKREKIALVVNEYGGTEGVVTMEDVVETLLGREIMDEIDLHPDLRRLARRQWELRRQKIRPGKEEPKE